ncbi:hypothetical protein KAR91_26310 [Candidatus Pacearchaeota archaeon]|nr:hypothetical protein [Candidatus Pacearchaeota archaeon]
MSEAQEQAHKTGDGGPPDLADLNAKQAEANADDTAMLDTPNTVEERLLALEADMAEMKTRTGLPRAMTPEEASAHAERMAEADELKAKITAEKELRKYVKRGNPKHSSKPGGFRKDLSAPQIARAKELMKMLDRKKPEWDLELLPDHVDRE